MTRTTVVMVFCVVIDMRLMKFLKRQRGMSHVLWVLDPMLVQGCCSEIIAGEALNPNDVVSAIQSWDLFGHVKMADRRMFRFLRQSMASIFMPDNQVSHAVADRYLTEYRVVYIPFE